MSKQVLDILLSAGLSILVFFGAGAGESRGYGVLFLFSKYRNNPKLRNLFLWRLLVSIGFFIAMLGIFHSQW